MEDIAFLKRMGFDEDPFQFTNADEEERLSDYFVAPPYFQSVIGNPKNPSSVVVFAPRGGGKSAQRRMIENQSINSNILPITYDRFEFEPNTDINSISLSFHLTNILKRLLLGFLFQIQLRGLDSSRFHQHEKDFIHTLTQEYLGVLSQAELVEAIKSLRGLKENIELFLKKYTQPIGAVINTILAAKGIPSVNFNQMGGVICKLDRSLKYNIETLGALIQSIGFEATYILVDRVDETELTGNDSNASFKLIEPLIRDLELLSMKGFAFKFFLWDEIEPHYRAHARADRVQQFKLVWEYRKIREALSRRLEAYSNGKIKDIDDITEESEYKDLVNTIFFFFANNSPRDVIRICQDVKAQQIELNKESNKFSMDAITRGVDYYCEKRIKELIDDQKLRELKRLHRADFIISFVASEIFKISQTGATSKIKAWEKSGLVKKIGEKTTQKARRPVFHYSVVDPRLARSMFEDLSLFDFIVKKVQRCPNCDTVVLRDYDISSSQVCHGCSTKIEKKL